MKVGRTDQDAKQVAQNAMTALAQAFAHASVHDQIGFEKLVQVSLKAGTSPELPVFNQLAPEDLAAFHAL